MILTCLEQTYSHSALNRLEIELASAKENSVSVWVWIQVLRVAE